MQRCCPPAEIHGDFTAEAALFKVLGDPHRLAILAALARADGEICVCDFTDSLPLNQPAVSHHLKLLRDGGLVECVRRGTWVYYTLAPGQLDRILAALQTALPQKATS